MTQRALAQRDATEADVPSGDSAERVLRLEPGRYVILCGYPGGGTHFDEDETTALTADDKRVGAVPFSGNLTISS